MIFVLPLLGFFLLTFAAGLCWWLMARRSQQWARWVDRENSYWLSKGLISTSLAARMKRLETGKPLKLLLAVTTVAGLVGLAMTGSVVAKAIALEHRKLRMPYNPALLPRRANVPQTNHPPTNRPPTNHPPVKATSPATNKTVRP